MSKYDDLVKKLKEIFQIDRPDLDFGIYRIINTRSEQINEYLEKRLKEKVEASLESGSQSSLLELNRELEEAKKNASSLGVDPESVPRVKELKERISTLSLGASEHENAVFSHLLTFFSRYYDNGDFISQRRYKGDTYAIPYSGEEVMLHWANKDQYYIKSGESFSNYSFRLTDGRKVHFKLVSADTAKDNRKENDKERRFRLIDEKTLTRIDDDGEEYEESLVPITASDSELTLHFEYVPMPKASKQTDLNSESLKRILAHEIIKTKWLDLSRREPTEKNPSRTYLEKQLNTYTAKNSSDYFIHKNLEEFLSNELDFYIKNEVFHLDDVQNAEKFADIEKNLRMIQCLRSIAKELISFLSQIEEFQKKIWLKKKFVTETNYCITLDRIPKDLYSKIAENEDQLEEWVKLGFIETKEISDLKEWLTEGANGVIKKTSDANRDLFGNNIDKTQTTESAFSLYLVLDTQFFGLEFKAKLISSIDNFDEQCDGLLIHSENFQALNLLQERYREQVKCVCIDPPYNTGEDGFIYKDGYPDSTWLSCLESRISLTPQFMHDWASIWINIDDNEAHNLKVLCDKIFGRQNFIASNVWQKRYSRENREAIGDVHEYILTYSIDPKLFKEKRNKVQLTEAQTKVYRNPNNDPKGRWRTIPLTAQAGHATPEQFYEIEAPGGKKFTPPTGRCWGIAKDTVEQYINEGRIYFGKDNNSQPNLIRYLSEVDGMTPWTWWTHEEVGHTDESKKELYSLLNKNTGFDTPKPSRLLNRVIKIATEKNSLVLDYFAGSGTTGHGVINLNREDKGARKYILVEMGDHFDNVLKPRMQKVAYSYDWKNGKATSRNTGISQCFKYLRLESYEDCINNLELKSKPDELFSNTVKEDYLLNYMLDVESRGSLLSVDDFKKPFDYKLKIAVDSAGAYENRKIDLVETFNYLIGLRIKQIDMQLERGYVTIEGQLASNERCLVLWRDCDKIDYDGLNALCEKLDINPKDSEYDVVYINGDHNIPSISQESDTEGGISRSLKLRQIETEFLSRMFDVSDV